MLFDGAQALLSAFLAQLVDETPSLRPRTERALELLCQITRAGQPKRARLVLDQDQEVAFSQTEPPPHLHRKDNAPARTYPDDVA